MDEILRLFVALAVVGLLGRATRPAWRHRQLALLVWRSIRPEHVAGSLLLLTVVLLTAISLMMLVPATGWGLGQLIGLDGNAVFAPLQTAAEHVPDSTGSIGPRGASGSPEAAAAAAGGMQPAEWAVLGIVVAFLGTLLMLFPWLAYVEERVFREGLEHASLPRQLGRALRFGLVHLIMLIPLAAAIGIAVAGFFYGRVYRASYRAAAGLPPSPLRRFRPDDVIESPTRRARTEAVLAATVWHTTFNSLIVVLLLIGLVASLVV